MSDILKLLKSKILLSAEYKNEEQFLRKLYFEKLINLKSNELYYPIKLNEFDGDENSQKLIAMYNFLKYVKLVGFEAGENREYITVPGQHGSESFEINVVGMYIKW